MRYLKMFMLILLLAPAVSYATTVAVLDSATAVSNSNYVKKQQNKLKARVKGQQDSAKRLVKELNKIRDNLQKNEITLSSSDKRKMKSEFSVKSAKLKSLQESLSEQMHEFEQSVLKAVEPTLQLAVSKLVDQKGIDILVDSQAVYFVRPNLDITDDVTAALNAAKIP